MSLAVLGLIQVPALGLIQVPAAPCPALDELYLNPSLGSQIAFILMRVTRLRNIRPGEDGLINSKLRKQ